MNEFDKLTSEYESKIKERNQSRAEEHERKKLVYETARAKINNVVDPVARQCVEEIRSASANKIVCSVWSSENEGGYGSGIEIQLHSELNKEKFDSINFLVRDGELQVVKTIRDSLSTMPASTDDLTKESVRGWIVAFYKEFLDSRMGED